MRGRHPSLRRHQQILVSVIELCLRGTVALSEALLPASHPTLLDRPLCRPSQTLSPALHSLLVLLVIDHFVLDILNPLLDHTDVREYARHLMLLLLAHA